MSAIFKVIFDSIEYFLWQNLIKYYSILNESLKATYVNWVFCVSISQIHQKAFFIQIIKFTFEINSNYLILIFLNVFKSISSVLTNIITHIERFISKISLFLIHSLCLSLNSDQISFVHRKNHLIRTVEPIKYYCKP